MAGDGTKSDARVIRASAVVLLGCVLVLTGCAAGSPAVVAPTAPADAVLAAPQAVETAPDDVAVAAEPTVAPAPAITRSTLESEPVDTIDAPAANVSPPDSAAFAQHVPAVAAPEVGAAPVTEAPGNESAAAQASRPAAPPAPEDGTILDYYRGPSGRLEVALTLDAGADRGYAEQILDTLRAEGILATFGMTGQWAEANPDLIQRMVAEGHQLINHTWSHGSLTGASTGGEPVTYERLLQELTDTEDLVRDLTGYELKPYFRPPYGDIGPMTSGYLAQAGYYVDVLWSCDSFGWSGFGAEQIIDRCTSAEMGGPGAIILMHVGSNAAGDFEALPGLIDYYRSNGYTFVTFEQLVQS